MTDSTKKVPLWVRVHLGPYFSFLYFNYYFLLRRNPYNPHVLSIEETIKKVKDENLSVIRFGDGEMSVRAKENLSFQEKNEELIARLKEVIQSKKKGVLLCVLNIWGKSIYSLDKKVFWFELHHFFKYHTLWESLLNSTTIYGDAFITRPYLTIKDKKRSSFIFSKMKELWENKKVVLIEGDKSRLGVGNDLFQNTLSLKRILCPNENAYTSYKQILEEAKKIEKDTLILIALGPTAKILASDLIDLGYRVLDIGHIDMEYDMFLRKEKHLVRVAYKYFNEINERTPDECVDEKYLKEVIVTIA